MKRLLSIGLSLLAIGCSADTEVVGINSGAITDTPLSRDRDFLQAMLEEYPDPGMTGLEILDWAYIYCGELVEGMPLTDLYDRIDLGANSQDEIDLHRTIVNVALDTMCFLDA